MEFNWKKFSDFAYSKKSHFKLFGDLDFELYQEKKSPSDCDLKVYQDMLVLAFIKENIPPTSRILEIGGGNSRVINHIKENYECWNLDKLEGIGNGPFKIDINGFRMVRDYIGNFSRELPGTYFDLVFSISVLEHVPQDDNTLFKKILQDIDRVLKPGGFSLHCIDVIGKQTRVWANPLVYFIFKYQKTVTPHIDLINAKEDPDIFFMSEIAYQCKWQRVVKKEYNEFGRPFSCNILWKKSVMPDSLRKLFKFLFNRKL